MLVENRNFVGEWVETTHVSPTVESMIADAARRFETASVIAVYFDGGNARITR